MFKKFLKIIGSFFLVLIVIFICIGTWYAVNSSKYTEVAQPYLETNMPAVVSWDFEQLRALLTPESLKEFETERGQKVYRLFSKLGALKSFEEPQFLGAKAGATVREGAYDIVNFSMLGHFEAGDAQFTITLATEGESYLIHYININSDVFLE
ncbi:hypothetical protein [Dasania marina]|uniref:hypothetical protein n=1 Tax=Dasania marina TaxID=471499 RepID=UPI00036EDE24|nr:hypothetical protein [Dasania marina]